MRDIVILIVKTPIDTALFTILIDTTNTILVIATNNMTPSGINKPIIVFFIGNQNIRATIIAFGAINSKMMSHRISNIIPLDSHIRTFWIICVRIVFRDNLTNRVYSKICHQITLCGDGEGIHCIPRNLYAVLRPLHEIIAIVGYRRQGAFGAIIILARARNGAALSGFGRSRDGER